MGGEDRRHVGGVAAQVETSGGRHPLVEMCGDLLRRGAEGLDVGGDHLTRGPTEKHRLDVVPLSRDRVYVVLLPKPFENLVLAGNQRRKIDQHDQRFALDLPAAHADADALVVDRLTPRLQQIGVLLELGVDPLVRAIGAHEYVTVGKFAGSSLCFGRNDGMDAADFVAYLPAHFEKEVGRQFGIAHIASAYFVICFRSGFRRKGNA